MTSNQIALATQKEQERHNLVTEKLGIRAQEEVERQNKRNALLNAASNINNAANTMSSLYGQTTGYLTSSNANAINIARARADRKYQEEMVSIDKAKQKETERYQRQQNLLTLRNIEHYEYQDWLQAQRDNFARNQQIFDNNQTLTENNFRITENAFRSVEQQLERYKLELQRAHVNVEQFQIELDLINSSYSNALKQAQTDAARAAVIQGYMNSASSLLNSVVSDVTKLLTLPLTQ